MVNSPMPTEDVRLRRADNAAAFLRGNLASTRAGKTPAGQPPGRWRYLRACHLGLLLTLNPSPDLGVEHVQGQCAVAEHCVVKATKVELRSEFLAGLITQLQNF